jgi:hypothetical protein
MPRVEPIGQREALAELLELYARAPRLIGSFMRFSLKATQTRRGMDCCRRHRGWCKVESTFSPILSNMERVGQLGVLVKAERST